MAEVQYNELDLEETQMYLERNNPEEAENIKILKGPKGELIISLKKPAIPNGYKYYNTEVNEKTKPKKIQTLSGFSYAFFLSIKSHTSFIV